MTDEERREMMRNNYAAQMEMLGYQPDGNPKDLVEVVRCKDCVHWRPGKITEKDDFISPACDINGGGWSADDYCSNADRKVSKGSAL